MAAALGRAARKGLAASLSPAGLRPVASQLEPFTWSLAAPLDRHRSIALPLAPSPSRSFGRLSPEPPEDGDHGTGIGGSGGKLTDQARLHFLQIGVKKIEDKVEILLDGRSPYQKSRDKQQDDFKTFVENELKAVTSGSTPYQKSRDKQQDDFKTFVENEFKEVKDGLKAVTSGSTPEQQAMKDKVNLIYKWQQQTFGAIKAVSVLTAGSLAYFFQHVFMG